MSNVTEVHPTPSEMRVVAATMVIEADRLEEKILRDSGRRVMRVENSRTNSDTGRYWVGIQTEKKRDFSRTFALCEGDYSHREEGMSAGQKWEDDEFSQQVFGLFELISERHDDRGNRIGLFAECLTDAS